MAARQPATPPALQLEAKIIASVHAALKSIPERRNVIPVCAMYFLEPTETGITVTATDLDIRLSIDVECKADFAPVCLPPFLIEAAGGLAGAEVKFAIDDRQVVATAGRARFAAPILPGADYPPLSATFDTAGDIAGEALAELIGATVGAAAISEARYYLEGIFLQTEGGRLHAVATDGHRLHSTSVPAPDGLALAAGIIVPTKAANEIATLAGKAGGNPVRLEASERSIAVSHSGARLVSKLIDGAYPDWRRVVPRPSGIGATVDLAEMLAALDRVMKIQAINEKDAKEKAGKIRLEADGEFLTIATGRGDDAEASDAVRAEFAGEFGAHGVSARYLRATLNSMKERGADTITIDSPDAGSPMRIESPTDEDFLGIVMPMRI